ncbi:MAG: zinc ribbon domain-containing protein [Acidobacteria bacterium]|nr:zinc ribbon domain-containing protein [Acidobacteriota bacterium]
MEQDMFCNQCGNRLQDDARFCDSCGFQVLAANAHTGTGLPPPTAAAPSHTRRALKTGIIAAAVAIFAIVATLAKRHSDSPRLPPQMQTNSRPERSEPVKSATTTEAVGTTSAPPVTERELNIASILLKPRRNADVILGRARSDEVADCEPGDRGYVYSDESYICVHDGNVILLSYRVKAPVSNPTDALRAVGLQPSVSSIPLGTVAYLWLHQRGNALFVSGKLIPAVRVFMGKQPTVVVDMLGWQAIQTKTVPKPGEAMAGELVTLLESDFPAVISGAEWDGSALNIFVRDLWHVLSRDRKLFITEAAHGRWVAVGTDFGKATNSDSIKIKHELSKRELAGWSPILGARLVE